MKSWHSQQIFPLILLSFLAALSFWLERIVDLPEARRDGKFRHDPDTIVEHFHVRRLNDQGVLQYRLHAPHMQHFADDDSSLIQEPNFVYYRPGAPDVTLTGKLALVTERGDNVYVWDNVIVRRAGSAERPEMVARTHDLTIRPDEGVGFTNSPVEMTQGPSWFRGIGMRFDNNDATFVLNSQVTGLMYRITPSP